MTDAPRIAELRRRVEADPASIAFAQLAEEYRREGRFEDAVRVCRAGLARYPTHHSARVTLARALTALGRADDARAELAHVLGVAPDHIGARRSMEATGSGTPGPAPDGPPGGASAGPVRADPALTQLESWLEAILRDRAARTDGDAAR